MSSTQSYPTPRLGKDIKIADMRRSKKAGRAGAGRIGQWEEIEEAAESLSGPTVTEDRQHHDLKGSQIWVPCSRDTDQNPDPVNKQFFYQ